MSGVIKLAVGSLALLILAACERGAEIGITQMQNGALKFTVTTNEDQSPCIELISVSEVSIKSPESFSQGAGIWSARAACEHEFVFDQAKAASSGFPVLMVGKTYIVQASGPGIIGYKNFVYEGAA